MRFTPKKTNGNDSYEKPAPGNYLGVLVGFADIGTQPSQQFAAKKKVMLRWELHKRKGPSLDSGGNIHTVTAHYGASLHVKSNLRKIVEAHVGPLADGVEIDSREWLGKAALLTLKPSDDGKWINVDSVSPLDPEDDVAPQPMLPFEHWETEDVADPPGWCKWAIDRSLEATKPETKTPFSSALVDSVANNIETNGY